MQERQQQVNGDGTAAPRRGLSTGWWVLIVVAAIAISVALSLYLAQRLLFPTELKPVVLAPAESRQLEQKLQALTPQRYEEHPGSRVIRFSERELNALLARNPDLAQRLAIHLDEGLASAVLLVPLDPTLPLLGGQTLRVHAGLELGQANGRPVVILRGVSLWGVPLPNSWLGNLKHVDLVTEFGAGEGGWAQFAAGIEEIRVGRGELLIRLKE